MYALSQILMAVAIIVYFLSQFLGNKKPILSSLIWMIYLGLHTVHYYCLEAYTGAWLVLLSGIVMFAAGWFNKNKKVIYSLFSASSLVIVLVTVLTWNTAVSLLPMFNALLCFVIYLIKNPYVSIVLTIVSGVLELIYMVLFASWVGLAFEIIILLLGIFSLVMMIWGSKVQKQFQQLEQELDQENAQEPELEQE